MTAIEGLQARLNGLGLKAVEARLENLLEQAAKRRSPAMRISSAHCSVARWTHGAAAIYAPDCSWHICRW